MRWRIAVSAAIGVASGAFCWFLMKHFHQDAADFRWALHLADRLLARQNPYDTPLEQYPLTAALFALPFVRLPPELAAGLFWGISSSLLAFGLTRHGYTRLLIFFAYPYWAGILTVQWSPIIAASAFFPLLLPLTMAKPQVGLPVFLTRLSRRGLIACGVVALASLAVMPTWPLLWWRQTGNYQHFFPLLVLPGPLLAARAAPLSESRRAVVVLVGDHAAALVLRQLHSLADSPIAARNCLDSLFQLGSRHLALVPHSTHLHRSRALDGDLALSADAGGGASAEVTARGKGNLAGALKPTPQGPKYGGRFPTLQSLVNKCNRDFATIIVWKGCVARSLLSQTLLSSSSGCPQVICKRQESTSLNVAAPDSPPILRRCFP